MESTTMTLQERIEKLENFFLLFLETLRVPSKVPDNVYAMESMSATVDHVSQGLYYLHLLKKEYASVEEAAAPKKQPNKASKKTVANEDSPK